MEQSLWLRYLLLFCLGPALDSGWGKVLLSQWVNHNNELWQCLQSSPLLHPGLLNIWPLTREDLWVLVGKMVARSLADHCSKVQNFNCLNLWKWCFCFGPEIIFYMFIIGSNIVRKVSNFFRLLSFANLIFLCWTPVYNFNFALINVGWLVFLSRWPTKDVGYFKQSKKK